MIRTVSASKLKAPLLILAFMLSLVAGISPALAFAQEEVELWIRTYDSGGNDVANGVAIDSRDNVIVTGWVTNTSGNTDFYTIKYDRNGNQIWSKTYDSGRDDGAYDMAVDSRDSIIVTGWVTSASGYSDYYTIKYGRNGNQIWSKTYDSGDDERAWGVAVDSLDNVIVTGIRSSGGPPVYYTIKYTKDGSEVWGRQYSPMGTCEAFDVAVDSRDNVIVTGQCGEPYGYYHTVKYDKDGNQEWVAIYGLPVYSDSEGKAIAVDSRDNIIVTGESGPFVDWSYIFGYCTIKYHKNGKQEWVKTYSGGISDCAWGVAIDSQDNVVVTGLSTTTTGNIDYYTIKYDRNGNEIWSKTYDSGPDDEASCVAIDSDDNIIVTGYITNASGNKDYCTIKIGRPLLPAPLPAQLPEPPPPSKPRVSPTPPHPLNPANMSLQYLSVNPQQTYANQPVTITTNVVNSGDEAGNYNVTLKINGQVEQSRMVSVGAKGTQPVKFTATKAQPGTYDVAIERQRASFTVLDGSAPSSTASGGLVALIAMAVLILATAVVMVLTLRRPA